MRHPPQFFFDQAVSAWLEWLQHNRGRAESTIDKYGDYLQRLKLWCEKPPEEPAHRASVSDPMKLTAADLEKFAGIYAHALGIGPRARRPLVSALRGFFTWANRAGHLSHNPAAELPQPRFGRRLPRAVTLNHAERLMMAPDIGTFTGLRDAAMIAALCGLGLRVSGLCALNESSLIWTASSGPGSLSILAKEKGRKERIVPAPDELAMLLRAYLAHPDLAAIDRSLPNADAVLFVSVRNQCCPAHEYHGERRRYAPRSLRSMLFRYADALKVPRSQAHPHALRHLYGAELAEDDADLITRQTLLGHEKAESTAIYSHLATRKLRRTVDKSNPLGKMRGPLFDSLRATAKATTRPDSPS